MKKNAFFFAAILLSTSLLASGAADYMLKHIYDNFGKISNIEFASDVKSVLKNGKNGIRENRKYTHYINGNSSARIDNLSMDEKTAFSGGKLRVLKRGKLETLPAPVFNRAMFYPEPAIMFELKNYFKGFTGAVDKADKSIIMKPAGVKGEYPRVVLKTHDDNKMIKEMSFYDKNKALYKKIVFGEYKTYNGVFFPARITVETFGKNTTKEEIFFSGIKINEEMPADLFLLE